ncbi:MAG TPA: GNAT family N-acetyltransferase [Burkholderiaceae bacterium]|nr:GNAT family N-acetyltransferase [Burkholderiaceae bacterium]
MLRHRLAALFEPCSLLVLADRDLPIAHAAPSALAGRVEFVEVGGDGAMVVPPRPAGVAEGDRLDAALVCVASVHIPRALEALAPLRPRAVVLLRHPETTTDPIEDMAYCQTWARLHDCELLGPHSTGVQRPVYGLNLSHETRPALVGRVALVTQSQSLTGAVLDWAEDIRLGFSTAISLGDEAVIDVAAVLDYLAMDAQTDSIVLYLENTASSRRFGSALRAAASIKPVVVLKTGHGRFDPASSEDAVFNALLRRVGAVRVRYFVQLFSALKVLTYAQRPRGRRVALFSNGHGAAQLAIDAMGPGAKVFCAELSRATATELGEMLDARAQVENPVVTHAPLDPGTVDRALRVLVRDPGVDGVLVLLTPDPLADIAGVVSVLARLSREARKPVVVSLLGDAGMRPLRHVLDEVGAPAFRTPETAANAFGILASYHYNQELARQILPPEPLGLPVRSDRARAVLEGVRADGRRDLTPSECQDLFACFHVPITLRSGPGEDDGHGENTVPMAIRVRRDPRFGPFVVFGVGGSQAVLSAGDEGVELPPLNGHLARQLVRRSALWRRVLSRELGVAACESLQEALERISDMVCDLPDMEDLEIDMLFAHGARLLTSRVTLSLTSAIESAAPQTTGYRHMAIHPYPTRLVQARVFKDGAPWTMRPIRPEDAEALQVFVRGLSDESRYMRFVSMLRELTPAMLARYTRIDYDRELALVAAVQVPNPEHRGHPRDEIVGFAHYLRNADGRGAEYALVIADAWQHHGLGHVLMRGLITAAREQGLAYIDGVVLTGNRPMLGLMTHLGFKNDPDEEDPGMRRVWLDLGEGAVAS